MDRFKYCTHLLLISILWKDDSTAVQLYNTEDAMDIQTYDCIYYTNITAGNNETIPYCIRTNENIRLSRSFSTRTCENSGKEWSFKVLKEQHVSIERVIHWNSSVELADRYTVYLSTGLEHLANETLCQCPMSTFGKFCEYQFLTMNSFDETIAFQFYLKSKYRIGSQLWGQITCYTTLSNCNYGLRCLTWQNICDGKQQCMNGIDEEHCEILEYNECEENEYRCQDGSCIAEQYWLDGEYDCSDRSDEQNLLESYSLCSHLSSHFLCDETMAVFSQFACGDGQFVADFLSIGGSCYNYRQRMFFCESHWIAIDLPMWTLKNGHCVAKAVLEKNWTDTDQSEKCEFYLKCKLTKDKTDLCVEATDRFRLLCENQTIIYPRQPVLKPYLQILYRLNEKPLPIAVVFNGSIQCRGHQARFLVESNALFWSNYTAQYPFDGVYCKNFNMIEISTLTFEKTCWNNTEQAVLCELSDRCISKYRVGDSVRDCLNDEDEKKVAIFDNEKKTNHRFRCREGKSMNLRVVSMGDGVSQCADYSDEYLPELSWLLKDHLCTKKTPFECEILKAYILSPDSISRKKHETILQFRQYCDTLWQLSNGLDEISCTEWKCPFDQYQCLSGHCLLLVPHSIFKPDYSWHCPDASNTIGLLQITQMSEHNARLLTEAELQLRQQNTAFLATFSTYCNATIEYGCILANVTDPLNFHTNRPCIRLHQIGDGTIDCYGGLDERNMLSCGNNTFQQRGFDFHCNDQECIPYKRQCRQRCSNNEDSLLCDQMRWGDPSAHLQRMINCGYNLCHSNITDFDKYYYNSMQHEKAATGLVESYTIPYRANGWLKRPAFVALPMYPKVSRYVLFNSSGMQGNKSRVTYPLASEQYTNLGKEGWICGRGVATYRPSKNTIQCFCPPSLYGEYCQYFSDRISVITRLSDIPEALLDQTSDAIKVIALLISDEHGEENVDDYSIFHVPIILRNDVNRKFRFNLIHRRPRIVLKSSKVRFQAYHLKDDSSIEFLAIWEYSIPFPFLPSSRLAQVLKFEKENLSLTNNHICRTANPCSQNSVCHSIINQRSHFSTYYCHCDRNHFGKTCEHRFPSSSHCLKDALRISDTLCLCPIHSYGSTCHLKHTCAYRNPCRVDRGRCYVNPGHHPIDYICICKKQYFGDHCEIDSAVMRIQFTSYSFVQFPLNFIKSSIIQLCDLHNETLDLIVRRASIYQGLPPSTIEVFHNDYHLPTLGILKLYRQQQLSNGDLADLEQPEYFILYITPLKISRINLTSAINIISYCPHTRTIFGSYNISNTSSLSEIVDHLHGTFNASTIVLKYHQLCQLPYSLHCFHDDNYFCICDTNNRAECSRFSSTSDRCRRRQCLADSQCLHGDHDDRKDFLCLCPRCRYGSICQHNSELFSFTLETLVASDLSSSSTRQQSSLLIVTPVILFFIGLCNNICCYVTFNRRKPLLVGIGHYLRVTSITNQLTLFILLLKLLHIALSIRGYVVDLSTNVILCKIFSYLLSCMSRVSYWTMCMVAIERVYVTWILRGTWLKSPRTAKRILFTLIIGVFSLNIHEAIYYQSIEDPKTSDDRNSSWCITSYPPTIAKYHQVNMILNYILPLMINLLSTIILIVLITRKKVTTKTKKVHHSPSSHHWRSVFGAYYNLLLENRELIWAPLMTLLPQLASLPQFILSFSFACREFQISWQRYLLLVSYFTFYAPQILSYHIYVSSSTLYTSEFRCTKLRAQLTRLQKVIVKTSLNNQTDTQSKL